MKTQVVYQNFIKYFGLTCLGTSLGWVYYQIKRTKHLLENAVDTSVLNLKLSPSPEENSEDFIEIESFYPYEKTNMFNALWESLKFSYALRLVRLANSDNKEFRVKAFGHLAKLQNLTQWQCSLLSSMIDPRTAVALARSMEADKRLLMDPPLRYHNYDKDMLVNVMRDFLISLYEKSKHSCLGYFLSKVFVYEHDNFHIVDNDSSALELSKFIQSEEDILPKCLESLLHHTTVQKHLTDVIDQNGLPLLMEIHHRYQNNMDINIKLCQIISFLSSNKSLLGPLHKSGWISILSKWVRHEDVRISVPAARALANLDVDDNEDLYSQKLYLLHPLLKPAHEPVVDVVFVHGLLGGVFYTWRQRNHDKDPTQVNSKKQEESVEKNREESEAVISKGPFSFFKNLKRQLESEDFCKDYEIVWEDIPTYTNTTAKGPFTCPASYFQFSDSEHECQTSCWPKDWLGQDCKNLRIIGINYETNLSMWASICPLVKAKFTLEERSNDLLERLIDAGLGKRPIVWVTHSMGGLIVKHILCRAIESTSSELQNVCLNTKGIVFYSTPHNGSRLANLSHATALLLWPSVEVRELRENSPQLKSIHNKFLEIVKYVPMKVVTFVETKSTIVTAMKFNFLLVEPKSGNPGVGEYFEIPQDHLGICKPLSRCSFLYQKVLHMLQDVTKEAKQKS